jgi:hypothetical protein
VLLGPGAASLGPDAESIGQGAAAIRLEFRDAEQAFDPHQVYGGGAKPESGS